MKNYNFIIILFLATFFASCTPQKRLNRIVKKNPWLVKIDTIKKIDTFNVVVPGIAKDSLIYIETLKKDTVFIKDKQLTIKTYLKNDTLYVSGRCDTIIKTVIREVFVPCENIIVYNKDKTNWKIPILIFSIIVFALALIIRIIIKSLIKEG